MAQILISLAVLALALIGGIFGVSLLDQERVDGASRTELLGMLLGLLAALVAGSALVFMLLANIADDPASMANARWYWRRVWWCLVPALGGELLRRLPLGRLPGAKPEGRADSSNTAAPAGPAAPDAEHHSPAGAFWLGGCMVFGGGVFLVCVGWPELMGPTLRWLFAGMRSSRAGAQATEAWQVWVLGSGLCLFGLRLMWVARRRP